MELSIVLPAYKEADNLKKIIPQISEEVSKLNIKYEILIIDAITRIDDTFEICSSNNATYVNREDGNYYGDAIRTGIKKASGKFILFMDADGSHDPHSIIDLYNKITKENYDVVVGSRYCKGGKTDNSFILKLMSWALNFTYKLIFSLKVNDCSNSFRIYDSEKLKSINLECINFDIVEEILIKLQLKYPKLTVGEIPIHFMKRDRGVSKRNLVIFIFTYFSTIKKLLEFKNKENAN